MQMQKEEAVDEEGATTKQYFPASSLSLGKVQERLDGLHAPVWVHMQQNICADLPAVEMYCTTPAATGTSVTPPVCVHLTRSRLQKWLNDNPAP